MLRAASFFFLLLSCVAVALASPARTASTLTQTSLTDEDGEPPLRLLLQVPYPERVPMLIAEYRCTPWSIIFAVAPDYLDDCAEQCGQHCTCVEMPEVCDSARVENGFSKYVHNLLIAPHANASSDLLFAHADFWLSNRIYELVRGPYRHNIVLPSKPENLWPESCYAPGTNLSSVVLKSGNPWLPWREFGPICQAGMNGTTDDEASLMLKDLGACCRGWVDLLYLPRETQAMFAAMATGMFNATKFHEGAIPTITAAIARANLSQPLVGLGCAGSCCDGAGDLADLSPGMTTYDLINDETICAHPVDLRNRTAWLKVSSAPAC